MSVVNRMLQDIDHRLAARGAEPNRVYPDIRSVPVAARASPRGRLGLALGLVAIAGLAVTWEALRDRASARAPAPAATPLPVHVSGPVAPVTEAPSIVSAAPVASLAPPEEPTVQSRSLKLAELLSEVPVPPAARIETPPRIARAAAPAAAKPSIATASRTELPVRQVAPDETVTTARALWADGARGAAVATLGEALAAAEAARNAGATAELARELARLEIAENRTQAALELLRRLEGGLAGDADAWALRGNAEQRLALHHDAAASYLAALRLRPGEGRWMVGAAISLAAEGKHAEAQGWVARARARGAITPPIAAYLQQIGMDPR